METLLAKEVLKFANEILRPVTLYNIAPKNLCKPANGCKRLKSTISFFLHCACFVGETNLSVFSCDLHPPKKWAKKCNRVTCYFPLAFSSVMKGQPFNKGDPFKTLNKGWKFLPAYLSLECTKSQSFRKEKDTFFQGKISFGFHFCADQNSLVTTEALEGAVWDFPIKTATPSNDHQTSNLRFAFSHCGSRRHRLRSSELSLSHSWQDQGSLGRSQAKPSSPTC